MMSNKITDFDVTELLPQRPPFIMIDKLIYYDLLKGVTTFTVREDNLFCKDGVMEESGLIENIAQTCAAKTGYKEMTEPGRDGVVKIGFIGMIKRMDIYRNPRVDEQLTTTAEILEEVFNATLVGTKVEINGELIATCEMKIYLTDKAPDALRVD
jgi:predicted hotdog family 3-hydroxylacyl-ACP dehydratase